MKAVKKICQATLALVLTISLVFSTGIKGVFADESTVDTEVTEFISALNDNLDSYQNVINGESAKSFKTSLTKLKESLDNSKLVEALGKVSELLTAVSDSEKNDYTQIVANLKTIMEELDENALQDVITAYMQDEKNSISDAVKSDLKTLNTILSNLDASDLDTKFGEMTDIGEVLSVLSTISNNIDNSAVISQIEEVITSLDDTTNLDAIENALNDVSLTDNELLQELQTVIDNTKSLNDLKVKVQAMETALDDNNTDADLYKDALATQLSELVTDENFDTLSDLLVVINTGDNVREVIKRFSSTDLSKLEVNGLELSTDSYEENTIYVGYEVTSADIVVETVSKSTAVKVYIDGPDELEVGNNYYEIDVVTLNAYRAYIVNVVRLEQYEAQGDGTDEQTSNTTTTPQVEPMVSVTEENNATYVSSSYSEEETTDETESEKEVAEEKEYDEEIEEDKGLNGLTVLLIVAGIALIGFGIYMLFGDKDDEIPTVKTKKTTNVNSRPNTNTNGKKTNNTKNKK